MELNNKFNWNLVNGWFNQEAFYNHLIKSAAKRDKIIEIGYTGKSTIYLTSRAKISKKMIEIINITKKYDTEIEKNIIDYGLIDQIIITNNSSEKFSETIKNNSIFAVYLNTSENIQQEIKFWYPKIKIGGFICGNNIAIKQIQEAIKIKYKTWGSDFWQTWYHQKSEELTFNNFGIIKKSTMI